MVVLSFMVSANVAVILFYFIIYFEARRQYEHFTSSVFLMCFAAFVENLSEPYYALMLIQMEFGRRAKAESVAIFFKSVLTYALVYQGMGLLAYALAQVAYSFILFCMYTLQSRQDDQTYKQVLYQHFKLAPLWDYDKPDFLERYMLPQ